MSRENENMLKKSLEVSVGLCRPREEFCLYPRNNGKAMRDILVILHLFCSAPRPSLHLEPWQTETMKPLTASPGLLVRWLLFILLQWGAPAGDWQKERKSKCFFSTLILLWSFSSSSGCIPEQWLLPSRHSLSSGLRL